MSPPKPAPAAEEATPTTTPPATAEPAKPLSSTIRVNAGGPEYKDSKGEIWAADQGFAGGDVIERPDITITNTENPQLYRSEHYGMDSFSCALPNGKYTVKLCFCETYEGISGPGERVFSFTVQGKRFEKFDVWEKAGGAYKAYVETVPVEVTNGTLQINFTAEIENPQINAIEITPEN